MQVLSAHASLVSLFATLIALCATSATEISPCSGPGIASTGCAATGQAGIALLQKRRTLTAVDASDDDIPLAGVPLDASGPGMADVAHAIANQGAPWGHASKAKQADANIAAPASWKTALDDTSLDTALNNIQTALEDGLNITSPSSYSLTAAGQGDGLSGSVASTGAPAGPPWAREGEPSPLNETLPPMSEEHIEPFGYPGAGLLLELHLPKVTLRELHTSSRGSLAQFLTEVREEIGKGTEVSESRLSILSIHGRYKRYEGDGYLRMRSDKTDHMAGSQHLEEEVVLRFEILPGWSKEVAPQAALRALRHQLSSPDSNLMKGPLGATLSNASVSLSTPAAMSHMSRMTDRHGMTQMSAMAWPIGISAAFIGVLIWLAAY